MRHVSFRTILEDVLGLAGTTYDSATQLQLDTAARFINRRVREAWEWGPWPEWTPCELRAFADDFAMTETYPAGAVKYDPDGDKYYRCRIEATHGVALSDPAHWEEVTNVDRVIAYEQRNKHRIGRAWSVTRRNVFKSEGGNYTFPHWLSPEGVEVLDCRQNQVWLLYSIRCPAYGARKHVPGVDYRYDEVVYVPSDSADPQFPERGECYRAGYDTAGNQTWIWVKFPLILQGCVTTGAGADMLRHYGQKQLASEYDLRAKDTLQMEFDKVSPVGRMNVRVMS